MTLFKWTLLMCGLLLAAFAHAQIYKWIDDQGRFRYGEKPPPGVEARLLGEQQSSEAEQAEQTRQQQKREEAERHARSAKVRARQCEQLREELGYAEQLQLYRWDRGEKVYMSPSERRAHAEKVRTLIAEHCR